MSPSSKADFFLSVITEILYRFPYYQTVTDCLKIEMTLILNIGSKKLMVSI